MIGLKRAKSLKTFIAIFLISAFLIHSMILAVSAVGENGNTPYDSYTYWYNYNGSEKKATFSRSMFNLSDTIISDELDLENNISKLVDSFSYNGKVYLLDSQTPQIIVLNNDYTKGSVIKSIVKDKKQFDFKNASGLFVNDKGIFIADTENKRVLVCDEKGSYIDEYSLPKSDLLPEDFDYLPIKVAMDNRGYLYVLSDGCYEGAILYGPDSSFLGFYGSNKVAATLTTVLKNIYDKIFSTDAKKAASQRSLPYQFNDLFIDDNNFVYTSTGNTADSNVAQTQTGQIKRMSPGGKNILNSENIDFTDVGINIQNQNIVGVEVDDYGFIYAIDSVYGHIFIFDNECNMVSCIGNGFSGGNQSGSFTQPTSLCINGEDIIVTDAVNNSVTVFNISEYGKLVKEAQSLTTKGHYTEAFPLWQQINKLDSNSQIAYIGLGKGYYNAEDYKNAMYYSEIGCDRETYALAFEKLRNNFLKQNFAYIILFLVIVISALFIAKKKLKIPAFLEKIKKSNSINTYSKVVLHPVASFYEIKEKKHGSVWIGIAVTVLYYIAAVLSDTRGGFAFTYFDPSSYNSLFVLLRTAGLIILFTVSFWCVSTLFGGLGKIKDIFIVVSYSFTPIVLGNVISLVLTNVLVPSELGFLNVFISLTVVYTVILLIFGLMIINDFEFGRFAGVAVLSIICMVIVLFLVIVIIMLLQLLWGFVVTIITEIMKLFK